MSGSRLTGVNSKFRLLVGKIVSRNYELNSIDRSWLNAQAGAIVELDSNEKPMFYADEDKLLAAWTTLRESYAVRPVAGPVRIVQRLRSYRVA